MKHPEHLLQVAVCRYLSVQYPMVKFISTGTSLKLTAMQASRNKAIQKNGFKPPDLFIPKPKEVRINFNESDKSLPIAFYSGLWIELKIECPFKKNGEIKASKDDHLKKQHEALIELRELGYWAEFAWSFDLAKILIDNYLKP